jgi:hypothetical protein
MKVPDLSTTSALQKKAASLSHKKFSTTRQARLHSMAVNSMSRCGFSMQSTNAICEPGADCVVFVGDIKSVGSLCCRRLQIAAAVVTYCFHSFSKKLVMLIAENYLALLKLFPLTKPLTLPPTLKFLCSLSPLDLAVASSSRQREHWTETLTIVGDFMMLQRRVSNARSKLVLKRLFSSFTPPPLPPHDFLRPQTLPCLVPTLPCALNMLF